MNSNDNNRSRQKNPQDKNYYRSRGFDKLISNKKALKNQKKNNN